MTFDEKMFSFDLNESEEILDRVEKENGRRDGRICICGHPMTSHSEFESIVSCTPAKMKCKCKKTRPVIEVSDTRSFKRRGEGNGAAHALSLGIANAKRAGLEITYLIESRCDTCQTDDVPISPVNVEKDFTATVEETGFTVFMCDRCRAL